MLESHEEEEDEAFRLQCEPLVISAGLGEEGNVMGLMRSKPSPRVSGAAMIYAAQCGHEKVVQALLKGKADVHSPQAAQALEIFVKEMLVLAAVPMFLKFGLDARSRAAGSVLEFAADRGQGDGIMAVNTLLKHRADPTSEVGYKSLQLASQAGHEVIVHSLVEARSDPTSHSGMESLKTASLMGQFKVVKILLAAQADASSKEGNDALHCAVHVGNDSLVKLLLSNNSDPSSGLPAAAFRGNANFVKLLLEQQADASSRKKAMKEAARFGHQAILQHLFRSGVDTASSAGDSALRLAVCSGRDPEMKDRIVDSLRMNGARRMKHLALPALPGSEPPAKQKKPFLRTSLTKSFKSFMRTRSLPNITRALPN